MSSDNKMSSASQILSNLTDIRNIQEKMMTEYIRDIIDPHFTKYDNWSDENQLTIDFRQNKYHYDITIIQKYLQKTLDKFYTDTNAQIIICKSQDYVITFQIQKAKKENNFIYDY